MKCHNSNLLFTPASLVSEDPVDGIRHIELITLISPPGPHVHALTHKYTCRHKPSNWLGCAKSWGGPSGDGEQRFLGRPFFGLHRCLYETMPIKWKPNSSFSLFFLYWSMLENRRSYQLHLGAILCSPFSKWALRCRPTFWQQQSRR